MIKAHGTKARRETDSARAPFARLTPGGPAPGARQVALVPGGAVPTLPLDLPAKLSGAAREQVARRQVTDMTGLASDQLDIRPFATAGQGGLWSRVVMADASDVAAWRAQAQDARALLPDYLALPTAPGLWTVEANTNDVMVRLGPDDGFTATHALAPALFARALADVGASLKPQALLVTHVPADTKALAAITALAEAEAIPVVTDAAALKALGLPAPKVLGHGELALDLRRDPYTTRARLRARVLPWRWPLLAGLLATGLWVGTEISAIDRLEAQSDTLRANTTTLVRTHFVPVGPILDVRTQVSRALAPQAGPEAETTDAPDLLDVFGRAAQVMVAQAAQPGTIRYTPTDGLQIAVEVTDFTALEDLVSALVAEDLAVTMTRSRASERGAEADLTIADAAAARALSEDQP